MEIFMATDVTSEQAAGKKRGPYRVAGRVQRALLMLASGEVSTLTQAAEAVQISRRGLSKALKRGSVQKWMQEQIMTSLGISALKAAKRMDELLHSPNEMVGYRASAYALATGAGVMPPQKPAVAVNINAGVGWVLDLREETAPLSEQDAATLAEVREGRAIGATLLGPRREIAGPVIEGEAVEVEPSK
jgi:hypothetical protein